MSKPFLCKEDYEGHTNKNNRNKYHSQSDNDNYVKINCTKKKSIKKMINAKKILLWLIKQMDFKLANMMYNKHRLNSW